jgi:AP2-associated kinase
LPDGTHEVLILMEFCAGGGIIDLLNSRLQSRLTEQEILQIFVDVCEGVAKMHSLRPKPLVHRDLKVENILQAGERTFKLCDFGSAAYPRPPPQTLQEIKEVELDINTHTTMQYRSPEMVDVYQRRPIDEKAGASLPGRDPHTALGPEADCAHSSLGQTSGRSASSSTSSATTRRPCTWTSSRSQAPGHLTERPPAGCSEEHGPLAILNVQYRVPPYPVYSNQLNLLVGASVRPLLRSTRGADWSRRSPGSMLQEHGSQRPSAVQLLKTVHSMRGTRPANHYVRPRCLFALRRI